MIEEDIEDLKDKFYAFSQYHYALEDRVIDLEKQLKLIEDLVQQDHLNIGTLNRVTSGLNVYG